ncbi:MAG: N-acetyltransferase family protein [Pseudomonadota bacterium]
MIEEYEALTIRPATGAHAEAMASLYNHYIEQTTATFELEAIAAEEMVIRMARVSDLGLPWYVALSSESELLGYCYATRWRDRAAYDDSVEVTVYVSPAAHRRGVGRRLYGELFEALRAMGKHVAIGGITLPNDASVGLHEKMGMHKVAHFEGVGCKFGRRLDVGYWQLALGDASHGE